MNNISPIISASRRRFTPLSLSPALWLDGADANTLYDATSGGSLVAADGVVARWEDKSGNSRHATQATLGSRPLRKTAIQNGKDVIRFDGNSDFMTHGLTSPITSCSIFAVTKKLSDQSSDRGIISIGDRAALTGSTLLSRNSTSGRWGTYTTVAAPANTSAGTSAFNLLCIIDNAASGGEFYFNGSSDGTWAGNSLVQVIRHVGGDAGASQWTHSDIAEILVYPTALSATNRQAVETYLSAKWAGGYDFDAADYFARIVAAGSTISSANQTAVNTLFLTLKSQSIWSLISELYLFAGVDNLTGCLVKAKGSGSLTNTSFVSGDHDRTTGLLGDGSSKYLNTGFASNALSGTSNHIFVEGSGFETSGNPCAVGVFNGVEASILSLDFNNGASGRLYRCGRNTTATIPRITTGLISSGSFCGTRTSSASASIYQNGSPANTNTTATSPAFSTRPMFVFALNNIGSPSTYTAARLRAVSIGSGLSDSQASSLHTAIATYTSSLT